MPTKKLNMRKIREVLRWIWGMTTLHISKIVKKSSKSYRLFGVKISRSKDFF